MAYLMYYHNMCLDELRKSMGHLNLDSWPLG
jgi:hypothetical protein